MSAREARRLAKNWPLGRERHKKRPKERPWWACEAPEDVDGLLIAIGPKCRGCMVYAAALAVNQPRRPTDYVTRAGEVRSWPILRSVRVTLRRDDPLRIAMEREIERRSSQGAMTA